MSDDLNRAVERDTEGLRATMRLLQDQAPFSDWSHNLRAALIVAVAPHLDDPYVNDIERPKSVRLLQHLEIDPTQLGKTPEPDSPTRRLAERLRADLADLTPTGLGRYLTYDPPVESRRECQVGSCRQSATEPGA